MSRWFRFYDDAINDPKIILMPEALRWHWLAILCVASKNDGILPTTQDVAFGLRISERKAQAVIDELLTRGLLDRVDEMVTPHNWTGRQYQSDSSSERVGRYRAKRKAAGLPAMGDYSKFREALIARDGERCVYCEATAKLVVDHMVPITLGGTDNQDNLALACKPCNSGKAGRAPEQANMTVRVTSAASALARYRDKVKHVTVTETPPEYRLQIQTTDTEKKDSRTVAKATRPKSSEAFEGFWKAYPRRLGANPRKPAIAVFDAAVRQGAEPSAIVEGARRCAAADHDKIGTPYIPQAVKWLRDRRWEDYAPDTPGPSVLSDDERKKMFEKLRGTNGESEGKGTDLRGSGAGTRQSERDGGEEPNTAADDQTGHTGVVSVGAVFRDASGLRAGSDETGEAGAEPRIYRAG